MRRLRRRAAAALFLLGALVPGPASAQHEGPSAAEHMGLVSANALTGAVTAAVGAWARGEDVSGAFFLGAVGGGIGYVGKLTATARFTGAPILGRQVAAVGHGFVAAAARGKGLISETWLPFSPFRVRVPGHSNGWGVQLDLLELTTLLYGVVAPELDFDPGMTLRYGTPVFLAPGHALRANDQFPGGIALSGTILVSGVTEPGEDRSSLLAHEMVHVIQSDFAKATISYPVEEWAFGIAGVDWSAFPVRLGLAAELIEALAGGLRNQGVLRELIEAEASTIVRETPRRFVVP